MRFGAAFWAQRTAWPDLRRAIEHAEAVGFDSVWIDDHLLCDEGDWTDPKLEGWTTLAAAAAVTRRVQLGPLVSANTFRSPGLTAKLAVTLDHASNGRAVLGLGAGWFDREHEAFGIDFGAGFGARLDRLAEAVPLIRRLLDGERVTHDGPFYRMHDAVCRPLPVQRRLPLLIGGIGPRKTLPLVARHADIWNGRGDPEALRAIGARLRALCDDLGRDHREIERSIYLNVLVRPTTADAYAAWEAVRRRHHPPTGEDRPEVVGTVDDVVAGLRAYADAGIEHAIWVLRSPFDLATMDALPVIRARLAAPAGSAPG
ncbi:MAG TPA: LLM class flavin-dependent oxidoreductase [Candidatus Limnocylindrales bacterium]|nr:LLM class flavin-dependent oxidoreductase [Candidatus Limnocylindrales bacterium]